MHVPRCVTGAALCVLTLGLTALAARADDDPVVQTSKQSPILPGQAGPSLA
jgi:hypothetical protein